MNYSKSAQLTAQKSEHVDSFVNDMLRFLEKERATYFAKKNGVYTGDLDEIIDDMFD